MINKIFNTFFALLLTTLVGIVLFIFFVAMLCTIFSSTDNGGHVFIPTGQILGSLILTIISSAFLFIFLFKKIRNKTKEWS